MHLVHWAKRPAQLMLSAAAVLALQACGGGGGGDTAASAKVDPSALLSMSVDNSRAAAHISVSLGDLVLGMALAEMSMLRELAAASTSTVSRACTGGGTVRMSWDDRSADGLRGAGDLVTLQFQDCRVDEVTSYLTGQVSLSVTAQTTQSWRTQATFGSDFKMVDVSDSSVSHASGSVNVSWQDTGVLRTLEVASSALDDLRLTANYLDESGKTAEDVERLRALRLVKTVSSDTGRYTAELNFRGESVLLKGAVTVTTPTPLSGYLDTYPDSGYVSVRGQGQAEARIAAISESLYNRMFDYDFDPSGAGGDPKSLDMQLWKDITSGAMWWGESYGAQPTFVLDATLVSSGAPAPR